MPITYKRKVSKVGSSLGITIPADVAHTYGLKAGSFVNIITDAVTEEGFILIDLKGRDKTELWKLLNDTET